MNGASAFSSFARFFAAVNGGHKPFRWQERLLDTFARLLAIALERIHFVDVAQSTTVVASCQ